MLKLNFFKQLLWQTTAIVNDDRAFAHNLAALKKTKQNNENIDAAYQKPMRHLIISDLALINQHKPHS